MDFPKTIHNFKNFPQALFDVHQPALSPRGAPLVKKAAQLISSAEVTLDQKDLIL